MPYLKTLRVEQFRGVLAPLEFSFAIPDGNPGSGLTAFVGPNNVGKSTIIEALRLAVAPPNLMDRRERHHDRAVRIAIASLFRKALALYDQENQSCVVIDEPELSLHPQAQKRLAEFISSKSDRCQIILCTHSPYFINWNDLNAGAIIYRLRQNREGIQAGRLSSLTIDGLRRLVEDWEKPQLLDPVAREVFFSEEVVFFEGQEDVGIIRRFTMDEGLSPIQTFG
jgi:predicted ATP-dependent endonuclease of OLD family